MPTDTTERGLETLIFAAMTEPSPGSPAEKSEWLAGKATDYDRGYCVDVPMLLAFLEATQPAVVAQLGLAEDGPKRQQLLARLQGEVTKRGIVDVLRNGIKHGPAHVVLFYGTPSPGNTLAAERHAANRFSVTRQLRYSLDETQRALDMALFINGLPLGTFELKNRLSGQTVHDAVRQYQTDRDPREPLFQLGRCLVHFAVDEEEVRFCTHLKGKGSWFLPFNKGHHAGAGNPPNPNGIKTDYLWREVLTRRSLTDIIENYAQLVEEEDDKGKKKRKLIFPRYHQLDAVRSLLSDARRRGVGKRHLIQHSPGSGKSNSIAWFAHQSVGLERDSVPIFDSVIVVTDRRNLDKQLRDTIKQFAQVSAMVGHAKGSGDLRRFLQSGKKIIITTVQKFPYVLDEIDALGGGHRKHTFAILIDEAHSSQGGRTAAKMNMALAEGGAENDEETVEDTINRIIASRKMLPNASYYAFTATPKNKTLEIFGEAYPDGESIKHRPFHTYTMKQAIQEGFILDVLQNYTPIESYYALEKTANDDPKFDVVKAKKKLRRYVESHDHPIRKKAQLMVDHFLGQVIEKRKIGGQARAMVVTGSIQRAIQYFHAIQAILKERKSPYRAIVAFSGEHEDGGKKVTEATLNEFPSNAIEATFKNDPYRFLICADKFQTGYDEPLLHTMYVDKPLSGIKAVQTLSRLNRAHPLKHDTFVLDFMNDTKTIEASFADFYRTTILSDETDPNKLHDLKSVLDGYQVYGWAQVEELVSRYLSGAERDRLDPILDPCVVAYKSELDPEGQVDFKGKAKAFVRAYGFLASILAYGLPEWEKLSIFLNFLIPKLPAPVEEDLSRGLLEAIDMESYRLEAKAAMAITLPDEDAEIDPVPTTGGGMLPEPELDLLSNILKSFNEQFGNIEWKDTDRIKKVITEEIPAKVAADTAYQNAMKNSDRQNARVELDRVLQRVVGAMVSDHLELYKHFMDNASFKTWLSDAVFSATYAKGKESGEQDIEAVRIISQVDAGSTEPLTTQS